MSNEQKVQPQFSELKKRCGVVLEQTIFCRLLFYSFITGLFVDNIDIDVANFQQSKKAKIITTPQFQMKNMY